MPKTRLLIVDDAVVVRRLLADALAADPDLEIAGTSPDGRLALAKIPQVNPDLVILDLDMPEMDGRETLIAIRKDYPSLPVIMFSSLTERGAPATIELLALGASDYAPKPANFTSRETAAEFVRTELVPKIRALCAGRSTGPEAPAVLRPGAPSGSGRVDIVAIGASAGGPHALATLLPALPAGFPVPVVIVQHMPASFTGHFAERLESHCAIAVREAQSGDRLGPATAWVAPGDFHMVLRAEPDAVRIELNQAAPENSCRPAVDALFRSVAEVYGNRALAVVLTGMGNDGLRGCEQIRAAGGHVIVQDEATSVVWGMPGQVAKAGLADLALPLAQIAREIVRRVAAGRVAAAKT